MVDYLGDDFNMIRTHAKRKFAGVVAIVLWRTLHPFESFAGEAMSPDNSLSETEGAIPLLVPFPSRSGSGPEPATVRKLLDILHEPRYVIICEMEHPNHEP
jgi:hypothetical protein